jgi:hypothetical protein
MKLTLPQFAEMTTESAATLSRREQQPDSDLVPGPTSALLLILSYLYELREGLYAEKVEQLRQKLATDPALRHFIGRFGAAALFVPVQTRGIPFDPLLEQVQSWIETDYSRLVERTTAAHLHKKVGEVENAVLAGVLTAAVATVVGAIAWWIGAPATPPRRKGGGK